MKESALIKKIEDDLKNAGAWYNNNHGNLYQRSGVSDIFACIKGRAFSIEAKVLNKHTLSIAQLFEGYKFCESGGVFIVAFPDYTSFNNMNSYSIELSDEAKKCRSSVDLSNSDYSKLEKWYNKINKDKISIRFE